MFEPFPGNYVWNLATNLALYVGGNHGEIDAACRPLREAGVRGEDAGTAEFFESWIKLADRVAAECGSGPEEGTSLQCGDEVATLVNLLPNGASACKRAIIHLGGSVCQGAQYVPAIDRTESYADRTC